MSSDDCLYAISIDENLDIMLHMLPITGDIEMILPTTLASSLSVTLGKFFTTLCNDATVSLRRLSGTEIEKYCESHKTPNHSTFYVG